MAVEDGADDVGADLGAALLAALGGGGDQLPLALEQLRGRVALHPHPPVPADHDRPLTEEPLGERLRLGERLVSGGRDRQALGERVHHVRPGERRGAHGQPLWARQPAERPLDLGGGGESSAPAGERRAQLPLADAGVGQLPRPACIHALLGL